jgi:hypothetical protein
MLLPFDIIVNKSWNLLEATDLYFRRFLLNDY